MKRPVQLPRVYSTQELERVLNWPGLGLTCGQNRLNFSQTRSARDVVRRPNVREDP
jgi:hypothetical protein